MDGVDIHLVSLDQTDAVTDAMRKVFPSPYRVRNWIEFNQSAAAGFALLKRVYALVLVMLIGVAAFNLVATLIMVVMEKRKDIAVLIAMGATRRDVRLIFVMKGLIVGAAGTAAGLIWAPSDASRWRATSSFTSRAKSTASRRCQSTSRRRTSPPSR